VVDRINAAGGVTLGNESHKLALKFALADSAVSEK
jgi:hypothetical protein